MLDKFSKDAGLDVKIFDKIFALKTDTIKLTKEELVTLYLELHNFVTKLVSIVDKMVFRGQ